MNMNNTKSRLKTDLCILGGGIAGLWLANLAKSQGFDLLLFDTQPLGTGQTIASQGMIHGGMKYTLAGSLTGASEAIAEMPSYWRECLCGDGPVPLRDTRILSDHFFLWSSDSLASKLGTFFASKITRGRVTPLDSDKRPAALRHADFSGSLYRLDDLVLDVPSLLSNLAHNLDGRCFLLDEDFQFTQDASGNYSLQTSSHEIQAQYFVLTAGEHNQTLLNQLAIQKPRQQLRPLQQVMMKHAYPFDFFGHCIGTESTPRLTISSHRLPAGEHIWYLGGSLAEKGAHMPEEDLIQLARTELRDIFSWLNFDNAEFSTLKVNRAEAEQPGFIRPDQAFAERLHNTNIVLGWPTKLTLAPNMANQMMSILNSQNCHPTYINARQDLQNFQAASIAKTPWEIAFPPAVPIEVSLARRFPEADDEENY